MVPLNHNDIVKPGVTNVIRVDFVSQSTMIEILVKTSNKCFPSLIPLTISKIKVSSYGYSVI